MISNFKLFSQSDLERFKKNLSSQFLLVVMRSSTQIIFVPFMILIWGTENFGIWVFLFSIPQSFNLLNLNIVEASKTEMIIGNYSKKKSYVKKIYANTFYFLNLNILFLIFLFLVWLNIIDISKFKIFQNSSLDEIKILIFLSFFGFLINILNSVFICGIAFKGKINIYTNIEAIYFTTLSLIILVVGLFTDRLFFAFIIYVLLNLIKLYFTIYYSNKNIILKFSKFDFKFIKKIFYKSISYYFENSSNILKHSGIIFITGIFYSSTTVAYISTIKTIFYFLPNQLLNILAVSLQFEYSKLIGLKNYKKLIKILKIKLSIIFSLILLYIFLYLIFGEFVFDLWTKDSFNFDKHLNLFLVIEFSIYIFTYFIILPFKSENNFFTFSLIDFLSMILVFLIFFISQIYLEELKYLFLLIMLTTIFASFIKIIFAREKYLLK